MDCSTLGFPVCHQFSEPIQTYVHWVSDAIQPSHPLLSPSPPALNLSQHQGLFILVSSSHQVAKVLEFQFQHRSLQWICRTDFLWDGLVGSPWSPRDSQESSPTPLWKASTLWCLAFFIVGHLYILGTFFLVAHCKWFHLIWNLSSQDHHYGQQWIQ